MEVRKQEGSSTWYNAFVVELQGDNIVVGFEDDIWPRREVPASLVRRRPLQTSEQFFPQVNEAVEVSVPQSESNPGGWSLGRIKTIKNRWFYFVSFEGASKSTQDVIVEKENLRKVNDLPPMDPAGLVRKLISVDRGLHTWIRSRDSLGCLNDVVMRASLLSANATTTANVRGPPKVSVIGDATAVELAEKLLFEIHFKNQTKMQRFHEHREKLMEQIKHLEQRWNRQHREELTVDPAFVGRIIGSKGANIKKLREELEVEIHIVDATGGYEHTTITITGQNAASVAKAREQMEYITVRIPVEPDQVGWLVGKGYENLQEIQKKADLHYLRYDDKAGAIEICGLASQVEDAKLMISVHQEYLSVYQDMSEERRTINQQFDDLDRSKGKRKGKGKGGAAEKGGSAKGGKSEKAEKGEKGGRTGTTSAQSGYSDAWESSYWEDWNAEPKGRGKDRGGSWKGQAAAAKAAPSNASGGRKGGGKKGRGK